MLGRQLWTMMFFWCALLCCFVLAMAIFGRASADSLPALPSPNLQPLENLLVLDSQGNQEPKIVVSIDGGIHAVHPVTLERLWSFESGVQMATLFKRGKESREINSSLDDLGGESGEWTVFPGPDGKLYIQDESGIMPLPYSIKQLVDNSPYHMDDGGVVLSTVKNTAYLLNKDTGELIRKFENSGNGLDRAASLVNGQAKPEDAELLLKQTSAIDPESEKKVSTILCLRTDYQVTVQELETGEVRWNVSLGEVKTLPLVNPNLAAQTPSHRQFGGEEIGIITKSDLVTMRYSRPSYQVAPIAVFSPTGAYISHLLPESSARSDSVRKLPNAPSDVIGKPSSMHRVQPIPDESNNRRLIPYLEQVGQDFNAREFSGQKSIDSMPNVDNRSARHVRVTPRAVRDAHWGTVGGGLLVIVGFLSSVWYLYTRPTFKKREEEVPKHKKVSAGKARKNRKRVSSTPNKGSGEEDIINEVFNTKQVMNGEASAEGVGLRRVAMDTSAYGDGIQVGRLYVTKTVIGAGSNGTSVYEGYLDGRHVAVKRLLAHQYDKAVKEIKVLITSDEHPNVVRYFAMEETSDFVYVALERCALSLNDLIIAESARSPIHKGSKDEDLKDLKQLKMPNGRDLKLWNENGRCSAQLLQLMRDIVAGLSHLHSVGIVHRDLKPHNVLVSSGRILQAKLADMGLSKHLDHDVSSYQDTGKGGSGSRGWQAPEQLKEGRQTRAVDIFSLGCVLFFCITGGQHPYGEHFLRDANIANGRPEFFLIEDMAEAYDLIKALLSHDPSKRPLARDIILHPFFWNGEQRLSFLRDASDRVELEDRAESSVLLPAIEAVGFSIFGASWESNLDSKLLDDGRRYRRYNFSSVRDLLRIIRNKGNHYRELPHDVQEFLGPVPEGFEGYFSARFPSLIIEVYKVLHHHCNEERMFKRYFDSTDFV